MTGIYSARAPARDERVQLGGQTRARQRAAKRSSVGRVGGAESHDEPGHGERAVWQAKRDRAARCRGRPGRPT